MIGGGDADVDLDSNLLDAPGYEFQVMNNIVYSAKQGNSNRQISMHESETCIYCL